MVLVAHLHGFKQSMKHQAMLIEINKCFLNCAVKLSNYETGKLQCPNMDLKCISHINSTKLPLLF